SRGDYQLVALSDVRDLYHGLVRGRDVHRDRRRRQFHHVDEDGDVVGRQVLVHRLRTHAATCFGTTVPLRSSSTRKRPFTMRYSNSSQKWRRKPCIGQAAASPKAQMVWPSIWPAAARSMCRSSTVALPSATRVTMRYIQPVPSRHGVHWPQLSCM